MSAEFNWWLLILGVVAGGVLTWLVLADSARRDRDVDDRELPAEAAWIARTLGQPRVDADVAEQVLLAHRRYLAYPPPDALVDPGELTALEQRRPAGAEPEPDRTVTERPDGGPGLGADRPATGPSEGGPGLGAD